MLNISDLNAIILEVRGDPDYSRYVSRQGNLVIDHDLTLLIKAASKGGCPVHIRALQTGRLYGAQAQGENIILFDISG